jgi:hypothetical protein
MNQQFNKLETQSIWSSAVKSAKRLAGRLVIVAPLLAGSRSLGWVKATFVFVRVVFVIVRAQGYKGAAIRLKSEKLLLEKWLAQDWKTVPQDLGPAVARTRSGIPRSIPAHHRKRIKSGDKGAIRLWLGLFTLYRVLPFKGKHSVKTIVTPGVPLSASLISDWKAFSWVFSAELKMLFGVTPLAVGKTPKGSSFFPQLKAVMVPLLKSGPNTAWAWTAGDPDNCFNSSRFFVDMAIWRIQTASWRKVIEICQLTGSEHLVKGEHAPFVYNLATSEGLGDIRGAAGEPWLVPKDPSKEFQGGTSEQVYMVDKEGWKMRTPNSGPLLGRLATKAEPGKVRVFAMVDSFTQWVLRPLHLYLFKSVLKKIPQDGLYDQIAPAKLLVKTMRSRKLSRVYSFDLSAATDRLPVSLQEHLLGALTSLRMGALWSWFMCARWFRLSPALANATCGVGKGKGYSYLRYAVGQPMGAYSSWAMLAITHHCIIQYCARQCGVAGWFDLYAILGDDIVIGHHKVALKYREFMERIGVGINSSKSITGRNLTFEFAKRFFWHGEDITPLPLSGLAPGWLALSSVPEIAANLATRGINASLFSIGIFVGLGFKAASGLDGKPLKKMSSRARALWLMLSVPGGLFGVSDFPTWMTQTRKGANQKPTEAGIAAWVQSVKSRVAKYELNNLIVRAKKALKAYEPVMGEKFGYQEALQWWRAEVRKVMLDPMREKIADVQLALVELAHLKVQDWEGLIRIYKHLEEMEDLFALLPGQLKAKRRQVVNSLPARVREWKRIQKILEEKP